MSIPDETTTTKTTTKTEKNGATVTKEYVALNDVAETTKEGYGIPIPPDGGWGWVVVVASFMCNLVVDGIMFSFGVFLKEMAEDLKVTAAEIALAGSLQNGFYLMNGPLVAGLVNRYGFRIITVLGCVISCLAFVISSSVTNITLMYLTYGVMGGIGAGMIYVPAMVTVTNYFAKWRALATGIAVCGSGIGAFVISPISVILIKRYGWRYAFLCQAGMLLHCAVFGMLFRPLKQTGIKTPKVVNAKTTSNGFFSTNNNADYPTAIDALPDRFAKINGTSRSMHSLHRAQEMCALQRQVSISETHLPSSKPIKVPPIYPELEVVNDDSLKLEEENNLLDGDADRLNGKVPTIRRETIGSRQSRADSVTSHNVFKLEKRRGSGIREPQRPVYRDDVFYSGSLSRLPRYRSQQSVIDYHMSVTRLPTAQDLAEEENGGCYVCPESVKRTLFTMLDFDLIKKKSVLLLSLSGCLTMMGFYTPFVFVKDRAQDAGIDNDSAMFLVSMIGIGNVVGRLGLGLLTILPYIDALHVNNIFMTLSGLLTIFSGLSMTTTYQFSYAALFGFSISVFAALRTIIVVDLVGLDRLSNAFGIMLLFQGIGATIGAPLAGYLKDVMGSYDAAFYFSGTLIVLSAVMCYPLKRINDAEKACERQTLQAVGVKT